jgi:histidine triad (HIT) family protein
VPGPVPHETDALLPVPVVTGLLGTSVYTSPGRGAPRRAERAALVRVEHMSETSAGEQDCVFCRIVAGEIPATIVSEGDRVVAFRDVNPQAPTHVLVIPRAHFPNVAALAAADLATLAELVATADEVAGAEGEDSYRLVFNTGERAGQSVFHVHGHVLAGRPMGWPPG